MYDVTIQDIKGIAYVNTLDDFENFIMDFYVLNNSIFESVEDWYDFFCEEDSYDSYKYTPDIMQLLKEVSDDYIPTSFPALVMFDFEEYSTIYKMKDEVLFESFPIEDLNIRKIETKDSNYAVAFV
jgi:hypothetical protein